MKIYERPILDIAKFDENVATSPSMPGEKTAYEEAQAAALGAVGNDEAKMFRVRLTF